MDALAIIDAQVAMPPIVKVYNGPNPADADIWWSTHSTIELAVAPVNNGSLSYGTDWVMWTPLAFDYLDNASETLIRK